MWTPEMLEEAKEFGRTLTLRMPPGGFTVTDLLAMPDYPYRIELTDGAPTVSPSALRPHQYLAMKLGSRLDDARTPECAVNQAVDVVFTERTTRIPDVLIARAGVPPRQLYRAEEVLVAVEIESPTSGRMDRLVKPLIYAEFGVPFYWLIELEPKPLAFIYRLTNGKYVEASRGSQIEVTEPFPFSADLTALMEQFA